jgi:hypothetical protein
MAGSSPTRAIFWVLGTAVVLLLAAFARWMAVAGAACLLVGASVLYDHTTRRSARLGTPLGVFWAALAVLGGVLLVWAWL